jgi:hypothetical protein
MFARDSFLASIPSAPACERRIRLRSSALMRLAIQACLLLLASGAGLFSQPGGQEFPIFCWHWPQAAFKTLENWQRVKECNFNVAGPTYYSPEDNRKLLASVASSRTTNS